MELTVKRNNKGMSLIEVMISLVILMIVSLALMQTSLLGVQENSRNSLRVEGARVADEYMSRLRNKPFVHGDLTATGGGVVPIETTKRTFRGFSVDYNVSKTITDVGTNNKQVTVLVEWDYKEKHFTHSITSIVGKI